ncbi:MAG: HD domain-containing protein [Methanobrevibacter sp.]|jgi:predicted metal-dependent HD superfamily phosphohydrolase|nr:HD domain-containing protein [Methanobrevibacter sp.]
MFAKVIKEMIDFFGNDTRRIVHSLKVFSYTQTIAELEGIDEEQREIAIVVAILHDIGIKIAEEKYGSCTAKQQEEEGPIVAENILKQLNFSNKFIERVKYIIAHHHHPSESEDMDFRLIIEADYLVNLEEGDIPLKHLDNIIDKHFRTKTGKDIALTMFK